MSDLIDSLEAAIRRHCVQALREHAPDDPDQLDTRSLVADYASWRARFPSQRPRQVYEADAMLDSPWRERYAAGLAAIRRDIEAGADLTRYLSSRARLPHRGDLLLAHSGIHHLHMSDLMGKWRVARTEHVLLVAFRPKAAYWIGIYAHERDGANYSERAILQTVVRNWPDAGILVPSRFAVGLTQSYDDAQRAQLHRVGLNLAVEIDGTVWSAPGMTANGAPMLAARVGMKVQAVLDALRSAGVSALADELRAAAGVDLAPEQWEAIIHEEGFGFFAASAGTFVRYGSLVE
jgi:hypothetical protein